MYRGENVEVSEKEHHILYLRGHVMPFYKQADLMESDPCIHLKYHCCICTEKIVPNAGDICADCQKG